MTTTNRFENLRRIIILLAFCSLLIIPVSAIDQWYNISITTAGNIQHHHSTGSPNTFLHLWGGDATGVGGDIECYLNKYTTADPNNWLYIDRGGVVFNTSSVPDDAYIDKCYLTWTQSTEGFDFNAAYGGTPVGVGVYPFNPSNPTSWTTADYHSMGNDTEALIELPWPYWRWNNTAGSMNLSNPNDWVNLTGYTCLSFRFMEEVDQTVDNMAPDGRGGLAFLYMASPYLRIHVTDAPPSYNLDLSASGTFCYGHEISFNLSETIAQTYGMYDISLYLNGDAVSKYSETIFDDGPLLWSKTLEPGNWACLGWWVGPGDAELTTWLNFTINSTCYASTYSGTINESYSPGGVTVYDWEWNAYDYLNNLEPWDVPTFDNGNGTSLIDYMYHEGYINETEYNNLYDIVVIQMTQNNNLTNTTMQYTYGVLTPLVMVNDSISTIRADVNSSYSVLNDAISPISTIFTWIFQIIPIAVIDLMSVILVFDAVRVILAGRKN